MEKKIMTLSFLQEDGRVLLAMKKRGFGEGRWNGYGGKVKEGETIEQAARREILEESGLQVTGLEKRGEVDFTFTDGKLTKVYIFNILDFTGEPQETEEMRPAWFAVEQIPYDEMWEADRQWLPVFLAGRLFRAVFNYTADDKLIDFEIREVDKLN